MILQSLFEYYQRKSRLGEIAPVGFEWKPIPFIIVLSQEGGLKYLQDTRENLGDKFAAKKFLVPKSCGRSGSAAWKTTFLLWDHWGYVLGYPKEDTQKDRKKRHSLLEAIETDDEVLKKFKKDKILLSYLEIDQLKQLIQLLENKHQNEEAKTLLKVLLKFKKNIEMGKRQLSTFIKSLHELPDSFSKDKDISAVRNFYNSKEFLKVFELENWMDCAAISGANLTFQIEGATDTVLANEALIEYQRGIVHFSSENCEKKSICMVTGKPDYIERLHCATPIKDGQATGKLVGFQKNRGFDSYGKEQAFNAPVGRYAQNGYTTALNTLLKSKKNHAFIDSTSLVFWSETPSFLEENFMFFVSKSQDDPDKGVRAVKQLYESMYSGKIAAGEGSIRFFVLGITPNAARISVRFWLTGTVSEFAENIKQHFDDLEIVKDEGDEEFFSINHLLSHTALDFKISNVIPNLSAQIAKAFLNGEPYPMTLLQATIRRIRAEQRITRIRAAIIKACINRFNRFYKKIHEEVITVSLDKENKNSAYLLGRLFAVLERIQYKALGISTIRERYYGAFSSTPVTVYPQLMKLKNHHLAKMDKNKNFFENLIGDIIDGLDGSGDIPRQLSLNDQGRFAVGYYHQRQDLKFKGREKTEKNDKTEVNEDE